MDPALISEHLARAERHIAEGLAHLRHQHALIAELERDGHDAALARELLATLERTHALHIASRDQLAEELRLATEMTRR
jgi:hypothetical protein